MTSITPMTSQIPVNTATIDTLGGALLAVGGGCLAAVVVRSAGSDDCSATLYSGTSANGAPITTFSLGEVGPVSLPNASFDGLYIEMSGTTAGSVQIVYGGQVP